MLIFSYHLNACLSICQFSLCLLCSHLGPQIHPSGIVMANRETEDKREIEREKERGDRETGVKERQGGVC